MNVYQYILQKKHSDYIEIELHLSERCVGMGSGKFSACKFCCQNHEDFPFDEIRAKIKLQLIKDFVEKQTLNKFVVNIMGGELFSDDIDDTIFSLYKDFIRCINKILEGKEVKFGITTNLVFTKLDRVVSLINDLQKEMKISLGVSYDPKLRSWTHFQLEHIFKPNIEVFKPYIKVINTVLHKKTIEFLLKNNDEYLDYLYSCFELDFSYYVPKSNNKQSTEYLKSIVPSDIDLKNILLHFKEKYPNSNPVKQLIHNEINSFQCCSQNRVLIDAYNKTSSCLYLEDKYRQEEFTAELNRDDLSSFVKNTINKNKCLECPYFNKCTFPCFALDNYIFHKKELDCYLKQFLNNFNK